MVPMESRVAANITLMYLHTQTCGWNNVWALVEEQKRLEAVEPDQIISLSIFLSHVLAFVAVVMFGRQRWLIYKDILKDRWFIPFSEVHFEREDIDKVRSNSNSPAFDPASNRSNGIQSPQIRYAWETASIQVGVINSELVFLIKSYSEMKTNTFKAKKTLMWFTDAIDHMNVAKLVGLTKSSIRWIAIYKGQTRGTVVDIIRSEKVKISASGLVVLCKEIIQGMEYLHEKGIVHGNLKGSCCLVDMTWKVKVTDWQDSKFRAVTQNEDLSRYDFKQKNNSEDIVALFWVAPELITFHRNPTYDGDVYSFGIVMQELFSGSEPYSELTLPPKDILTAVLSCCLRPKFAENTPPVLRALMDKTWELDPAARPTFTVMRQIMKGAYPYDNSLTDCIMKSVEEYASSLEKQLPDHILGQYDEDDSDVPRNVADIDDCSVNPEMKDTYFGELKVILGQLMNFESRRGQEENVADDEQNKYAVKFFNMGGVDFLIRQLTYVSLFPQCSRSRREDDEDMRIKAIVLEILTKMTPTTVGEQVTSLLMDQDDILSYMFTLLAHKKTFINSCQLIEDMLQTKKILLDLNKINNIRALIGCLKDEQLANFCRILAVAISDLDIYDNKSSLFAQNKQKRSKGFVNVRDINQELLLSIPELLPRLVGLAVSKEYTPRFRGMVSELDCWMEWIENQMAEEMYDVPTEDDMEDFVGGITIPTTQGSPMVVQQGLKITEELVQRVEVVYVLGLFLLGKHRKKVQRKLAELKLAPGLSELFDQFIWKCQVGRYSSRHRMRGHNAACECSPEVALKIQFLRLVHSFCDHSDYKHLLLSKNELNEVKRINGRYKRSNPADGKAGPLALSSLDNINKQLMCKGSKGLLTKIVEVMKKEPTTSTFRFWLARAVESYLRGNTSYCDQVFLMRRGLLQHVATNIVEHEIRHKEILQSSFDLLGELVKFNIEAFQTFDSIFTTQQKFDKFINTVNRNLVDSNMFIRSLVLSLEHFVVEEEVSKEYVRKESKLLMYIGDFSRQLDYLHKLITIIDVHNLTQENVSCLNTTLVFLMFANRKNNLPRYLQALKDEKEGMLDVNGSVSFMTNFRDLLLFWQDHYLHKDKDCSALEKSSRISFEYWKQTVSTLVSEDKDCDCAIVHYCTRPPCERTI